MCTADASAAHDPFLRFFLSIFGEKRGCGPETKHHEPVTGKYSGSGFTTVDYTLRVIQSHYKLYILLCVYIMIEEQLRDLESSLACRVCLHSLLRDCVGEDMQSTKCTTATRTQLHTRPYTHACTHTSKYIIMNAQKVSEVTMTSPNHAFQYCHDYVCSAASRPMHRTC